MGQKSNATEVHRPVVLESPLAAHAAQFREVVSAALGFLQRPSRGLRTGSAFDGLTFYEAGDSGSVDLPAVAQAGRHILLMLLVERNRGNEQLAEALADDDAG